jgi:hypothetical protein
MAASSKSFGGPGKARNGFPMKDLTIVSSSKSNESGRNSVGDRLAGTIRVIVSFGAVEQRLAADGAIASFSSKLVSARLNADCAPQLTAVVMR